MRFDKPSVGILRHVTTMATHLDVLGFAASVAFSFWGIDDPRNANIRDTYDQPNLGMGEVVIGSRQSGRGPRPPWYVFAIVWPLLYAMTAASLFLFWRGQIDSWYLIGLGAFSVARVLNRYWTLVYTSVSKGIAAWMIVGMQVAGGLYLASVFLVLDNPTKWVSAALYMPLLAWQTFALYLNVSEYRRSGRGAFD